MFFPFFFFRSFSVFFFFFFKSFSCVDEDDLGFLFVSSFVLGFGGRAEGNVHILEFKKKNKHLDIKKKKKKPQDQKGKGREKIIFKIIQHKNPGASYIIKYVLKKTHKLLYISL